MINVMWVIVPWAVIIIFAAGWYFGGKIAIKNEKTKQLQEDRFLNERHSRNRDISDLYECIDRLDEKIERMFAVKTKEEN